MTAKSLEDLEWSRVVDAVAGRCRGPLGARMVLPMAVTRAGAERALAETGEAMTILAEGERLPVDGAVELEPHLSRVSRQASLDGPALRDVMRTLSAARALRRFLGRSKDRFPALHHACALDPTLDRLHEELAACIDPDGTLADHASPELRRLRGEVHTLRARIVRRLEQIVVERDSILQDRFHTIREGRYVLPVRRDAHEKLQGIVHGTSASGQTVFVEPRALVAQGNRLKMAQSELEREEARILAELSELVRERLPALGAAIEAIDHADLRQASAQLGRELEGRVLPMHDDASFDLERARHPLLLLDGVDVVPCDLSLRPGQGLVLSGPNAGGKTVALKTLGLAALFTSAGLPFPAAEGSRAGFVEKVLTDVGDDQSLQRNLSTFSAHMTHQARILRNASEGTLVLLDEVATGTDPEEGAALACALVDALLRRGAGVAVTTHYEPLKAMATRDERLENAAVGFDVEAMAPTFELLHGVPGASSAFAVARRFGIPDAVLQAAEEVLPEHSKTFDELVRNLETQRRELALARAALSEEKNALVTREAVIAKKEESLREKKEKALDAEAAKLRDALRRSREDLRRARRLLKKKPNEQNLDDVRRRIEEAAQTAALRPQQTPEDSGVPVDPSTLRVGARVWVPRLRSFAEILEDPKQGRVRVIAGALRLFVNVADLRKAPEERGRPKLAPAEPKPAAPPSADNTLDVRGLRVDEALGLAESFLDRMYGASETVAYILHGIGTGALRDAIRTRLHEDASYVKSFRAGTRDEGGERLTVVTLK